MVKEGQIKNIAYFFRNSPEDTLGYHRLIGPAQHLGLNVIRGFNDGEINVESVSEGDIVVIQRDFSRFYDEYERIITLATKEKKPVVLDLDDLLLELPEEHPDRQGLHYTEALLPMLQQRPGAFEHAKLLSRWRQQWSKSYERLLAELRESKPDGRGVREFLEILKLHQEYPEKLAEQAFEMVLDFGAAHLDGVKLCLWQLLEP